VDDNRWRQNPTDRHVETPLLLNPYSDQPQNHIAFAPAIGNKTVGTIRGTTTRGEATIRICRLDRPELDEERRAAQRATIDQLGIAVLMGTPGQVRDELLSGRPDFSAARLAAAESWIENIKKQWLQDSQPL
jgi:hypothetical protein